MSFLDRLRGHQPPADEIVPRAIMAPAVSAMLADGVPAAEEISQLSNLCLFSPIFAHLAPERLAEMVREIQSEIVDRGGRTVLEEAAATLPPALRETAFCFAVRIAMADGTIPANEEKALEVIAGILGLSGVTATTIYTVIAMLQRPADFPDMDLRGRD
ncbi:MAG: tellurite resistance TerB family protein [Pseudomonadota bacterium]